MVSIRYHILILMCSIMPPLDAKQQGTLTKHPVVKHPVAKHPDQPKLTNDDPITVIESIHPSLKGTSSDAHIPTHAPAKEEPTTKAIGEDLPRPQSAYQATVEEESSIDDLFIEKPEPSPSEDAKPVSNPQLKEDSIFGEKRAKEAAQNPQVEQVSTSASLTAETKQSANANEILSFPKT